MPRPNTCTLNLADAKTHLPLLDSLVEWRQRNREAADAVAIVVPENEWPRQELGVDASFLLIVVPGGLEPEILNLASAPIEVYNCLSDDLLTSRTLLGFDAGQSYLEVNAWTCDFPRPSVTGNFFVGLVAGESYVLSRHALGDQALEELLMGIQGACSSSGPNYRPCRLWSEDQLAAAARGEDVLGPSPWFNKATRRVNCEVLRLTGEPEL